MPKRPKPSRRPKPNAAAKRARASSRRISRASDHASAAPKPARSPAMILAGEVERLERELEAAREQMAALAARADIDPLANVLNRRGFERELRRSIAYVKRHGTSAALIYLDLDDFKRVNDRHGHAAGDAVLKAVAMVLGRHVRASDVVARLGGDEFAVLLWNLTEADAAAKAHALEAAVSGTTATYAGTMLSVGASAGIAMLLPLDQPVGVIERADRAMYARKRANRVAAE